MASTRKKFEFTSGTLENTQIDAFDQGNRLAEVPGTFSESCTYDGHGRRTTIQVGAGAKKFQVYARDGKLLRVGATSAVGTERYIYLGAHLVAKVVTGAGGLTTTRYQHTDGVGTPVAETDASGVPVGSRQLHEPYGLWSIGTPAQGPSFTGHVYDAQTGLNYMQQRYHDPIAGRFLSVDTIGADSESGANFNRYWYANNNPYKFTDPDGRMSSMKDHPSLRDFVKTMVVSAAANILERGAKAVGEVVDDKVAEARHEIKSRTSVKGELGAAGGLGGKVSAETDLYGNKKVGGVVAIGYGYSGTVTGEFEVATFKVSNSLNTFLKVESAEITLAAGPAVKLSVDFDPGGTAAIKVGAGFGFGGEALINKPLSLGVEKEFPQ